MEGSSGRLKGEGRASLGGGSFFKGGCAAGSNPVCFCVSKALLTKFENFLFFY
jgi:hypothetical protein